MNETRKCATNRIDAHTTHIHSISITSGLLLPKEWNEGRLMYCLHVTSEQIITAEAHRQSFNESVESVGKRERNCFLHLAREPKWMNLPQELRKGQQRVGNWIRLLLSLIVTFLAIAKFIYICCISYTFILPVLMQIEGYPCEQKRTGI